MSHTNSVASIKQSDLTDENKCWSGRGRRSFKEGLPNRNHHVENQCSSAADRNCRNSITLSGDKEDVGRRVYLLEKVAFCPEIRLGNRIIEDLTSKYRTELVPLNSRHLKRDVGKEEEVSGKIQRTAADSECLKPREKEKRAAALPRKKAVTFLDDKLKNGFTNAGFVLSPTSINETDKNESSGGFINDGFVSSPVTDLSEIKKRSVRPKPIISPTDEFLCELNENFTGEAERICDAGSDQRLDSGGIELAGKPVQPPEKRNNERKASKNKIWGRKRFVNQMKKISNEKSISKENVAKQKKYDHGLLSRKKPEDKCLEEKVRIGIFNKNLSLSSEEIYLENRGDEKEEEEEEEEERKSKKTSKKKSFAVEKSREGSDKSNVSNETKMDGSTSFAGYWNNDSMSKLPIVSQLKNAESVEDLQNISDTFEINEKGMDFWVDGFKINNRKKLDKINKINIHLHALFSAVENGHVEKARTILESSDVDVNSVNGDNLTPLDVAVLTNHRSLAKMLVAFGAQEGRFFQSSEKLGNHLKNLVIEAERKVQELNGNLLTPEQGLPLNLNNNRASFSIISHYPTSSITCHGGSGDSEKELLVWERRSKGLKKILLGFEQTRPPGAPFLVTVDVIGTNAVTVKYRSPEHQDSSICTKFKIEWSERENFEVIAGEKEILHVKCLEYTINGLEKGKRYWFRVACGNLKGYGNYKPSTPASVVPSSWRDVQKREPRFSGRLQQLEKLFLEVRNLRPETASEIKDFSDQEKQELPAIQRRNQKKKTIKQLFNVAGKFQKNLKRGVYLVCMFYHDDKVLVTNEDFLPAIEVDETYPSSIYNDLHWFMKVACTWNDVKSLKQDMERNLTSTTSHFRIKLLQAAQQMQSALSTQDLGQLYYKPIRDAQGTLVFCSVNSCPSLKSISVLNLKWTPINKVQRKIVASEESNVGELLMASIQAQINYHQVSNLKLSRGLYLGYLKMKSSVDLIQIIVPSKSPNVLPHCKIRDNPYVSSDEWEWLKRINSRHKSLENLQGQAKEFREADALEGTEQQQIFVEQIASTARRLFSYMDVNLEDAMLHRLYDVEVVDLSSDVSFLIIVPPVENSCSVPGQQDTLLERGDLMSISLQVFEMLHFSTYQPELINRYSRLSCILELDVILAQHSHREAFSPSEVQVAKDRLNKLQELQIQLNGLWKSDRWIMDVITFTRDRNASVSYFPGSSQVQSKSTGMTKEISQGNINKVNNVQANYLTMGTSGSQPGGQNLVGVSMKHLLALTRKKEGNQKNPSRISKLKCSKENHQNVKCEKITFLQIPDSPKDLKTIKSNMSRGSWPGPGVENSGPLIQEHSFSKSEQHLNVLEEKNVANLQRKYSDCSSDGQCANCDSSAGSSLYGLKCEKQSPQWDSMTKFGNRMLYSKSEDHLFLSQELRSFKQTKDYKSSRSRSTVAATTSVSATNSPLLPQRNICKSNLNRMDAGSLLSMANTNISGSLHSISSDESTAAVVSLPVTTPFRSALASNSPNSVPHPSTLLSLTKPTVLPASNKHSKSKIPLTVSLNSLTETSNLKRVSNPSANLVTTGSILSGNIIPVNISQKPMKTTSGTPDPDTLNQHISSSLPSFSKHSTGVSNLIINPFSSLPGKQRHSPVKSPIKAVSPVNTVLSGATSLKGSPGVSVDPFIVPTLPPDIDLLSEVSVAHSLVAPVKVNEKNCETTISTGFLSSSPVIPNEAEADEESDDLKNGVKLPNLNSGVLQVYAAYETGLAAGTSLKLHITPRTSAREVVDLVVKQLNMAVLIKGKDGPIYSAEKLKNFCLVAVIGARERCLRDDFKPLQLQNPWKKGRLYVRQKQDVLAALEHSSRQSAFL